MGINSLLPFLERSTKKRHISEFRGQTVVVDAYCWLHKGARGCAMQLAKNEETYSYIFYCLKYVNMLLSYEIKPILVFDGRDLPAKKDTNSKRAEAKNLARKRGMECLRAGQINDAYKYFTQSIDITPVMAMNLIKECRKINVDCIVAPYEADAQLAFFLSRQIAQVAISEDSDLIVFGCSKVLYKMDLSGTGFLVDAEKLNDSLNMREYSFEKFRYMCILAGCDYLDSLPGIGLKKALKFLNMTAETDPALFLPRIPRYLNIKRLVVPDSYKTEFLIADATFKHQTVFDPFLGKLVPLNPIDNIGTYCVRVGDEINNRNACQIALGNMDPRTYEQVYHWNPKKEKISETSIWSPNFKTKRDVEPKPTNNNNNNSTMIQYLVQPEVEETDEDLIAKYRYTDENQPEQAGPSTGPSTSAGPSVSNTNIFAKKKLSKFQMTPTNSEATVLSRYFTSARNSKDKIESEDSGMEQSDSQSSEGSLNNIEVICLLEVGDEILDLGIDEPPEPLMSVENMQTDETTHDAETKKRKRQMTIPNMFKKMRLD